MSKTFMFCSLSTKLQTGGTTVSIISCSECLCVCVCVCVSIYMCVCVCVFVPPKQWEIMSQRRCSLKFLCVMRPFLKKETAPQSRLLMAVCVLVYREVQ